MPDVSEQNPHRLPRTVLPRRYDLTLEPDLEAASFTGSVAINVDVVEATMTIVLNAAELEIDEAWVERDDGRRVDAEVSLDAETERAILTLGHTLFAGSATVHMRFKGVLNDKLVGFYRSTFTDDDGNEQVMAATQMEATHARQAFPCWDEPDLKAVFSVTLVVPEDLLAISNGAEWSRQPRGDGKVEVLFADTIPMSTYLVAFVVGPLEATEPVDVDGVPLRVVHPLGRGHLSPFALDVGAFCLRYFTDWFGIPYMGGKLDLVAIPDFAFGAMENLGCVTFRERYLLIDPETTTQAERQAVVDVIAHELAHMWFGDLVTMKWWNGIWLNEAFATFMEMKATDTFRPDWHRWVDFGLSRSAAFDTDALTATRPIEFPVVSPEDAEGMFDVLTYEKGASVVRMLEQYLGSDRFRDGLRRYMLTHQFGNTETTDLWDALEEETGEPVRRIADTWIFQGGFPEVIVEGVDGDTLRFTQRRFRYSPPETDGTVDAGSPPATSSTGAGTGDEAASRATTPNGASDSLVAAGPGDGESASVTATGDRDGDGDGSDGEPRWAVPLVVDARSDTAMDVRRLLLDDTSLDLKLPGTLEWVNANLGASGCYRVRYSDELRERLIERRRYLSPLERYVLVDDTWAGVLAGTVEAAAFLTLAERFTDENDLSVWQRLTGGLGSLERVLPESATGPFAERVRAVVSPAYERLGPEPEPDEDDRARTLRGVLVTTLATVGDDKATQALCATRLDAYLDDPEAAIDPSLASAALGATATLGDVALHERLVARFETTTNPQDRERVMFALARFRDAECLRRTLELSLSGKVRTQDAPYLLRETIGNRDNGTAAWDFVASRWDEINERFPTNSIPRMVSGIRSLRDREVADRVVEFLAEHPIPQGELQVRQHIERMWVSVRLAERESERLAGVLQS